MKIIRQYNYYATSSTEQHNFHNVVLQQREQWHTKCRGQVISIPVSYSGEPGLNSQEIGRLS
jgi:hypothetical protein